MSGGLGILSFPIFGRPYQLDLLVFLILLPLMLVAQGVGKKRGFVLGGICGLTFVGVSFSWVCHTINEFTGMGTLLSLLVYLLWVAYEAVPWAVMGLALGRCRKSLHCPQPSPPSTTGNETPEAATSSFGGELIFAKTL